MNFVMLILNQNIKTMQNLVTWILTALLFILKRKIFMKMLQMMLKKKMIHQIMTLIDHFQQKRIIRLMKDKPGGKIMTKFAPLRPKKCEYLEKNK